MERKFFDPPAQVQEYEEAFGAILKRAGALNTEIKRNDKLNIQKALEIGRILLRARPMAQDDWEQSLETVGISSQRASEFSRGAEAPSEAQAAWESIGDMRRWLADQRQAKVFIPTGGDGAPTQEDKSGAGLTPPPASGNAAPKSTSTAAGVLAPPVKPGKLCVNCQRRGYRFGCLECKKANGGKPDSPPPERATGDEEESKAVVTLRKKIETALKSFRTELNRIAKTYAVVYQDGKDNQPAKYEHPLLQKAFDLYLQAKKAALKAEWELRKAAENVTLPD